jgi:SAM-dependent methyltransferase
MGGSPVSLDAFVIPLVEGPRILDVGCGFGKWGSLCATNYWETINPDRGKMMEIVGCEGYLPNVEMAQRNGYYTDCVHLKFPPLPFEDSSFDTVLMIEIIEHLPDAEAERLIAEAKRIARKRIVLSTPNFPDFRKAHASVTGLNDLDSHLSYWSRSRLRKLGFIVRGTGLKLGRIRGVLRRLGMLPWFEERIRPALYGVGWLFPVLAQNTIAVWTRR